MEPATIREALKTEGMIRLPQVLDPDFVRQVFRSFETLFDLSEDQKIGCRRLGFGSGYTPTNIEGVRDLPKDSYRSFWDIVAPNAGCNRFPASFEEHRSDVEALYRQVEALAIRVFTGAYPSLQQIIRNGAHGIRATHFRPRDPDWIVMPCHLDIGFITVYVGGSSRGLEGKIRNEWTGMINPPGDVIIGAGTTLRMYEQDVVPLRHRVISSGVRRISLAFFLEPSADVVLPNGEVAGDRLRRLVNRIRRADP